ncbi:BrnT family toxin [Novosphingobium kaempferiae]|uniref:BrnT family toxin n=1 Tax=Novosphingobium kaempferiae TaxID=2896849 RepID=UPI001E2EAAFA|nr:BrnT family toxin [Novosphingobium kaempferiae]
MQDEDIDPTKVTFDACKRTKILQERGLDLADAHLVFEDTHIQIVDDRKDYGEIRYRVFGFLHGRRVSLVWTPRDGSRRIITMRHAHHDEHQARFRTLD